MTLTIIIFLVVLAVLLLIIVFLLGRNKGTYGSDESQMNANDGKDETAYKLILEQINEVSRMVDFKVGELNKSVEQKMGENSKIMTEAVRTQFGESQRLIKEITNELVQVKEGGKQVASFAEQLQNLQDILKNPKQRGILGEYYLETLLNNVMPPGSYQMQYAFKDGTIVDAVVFVKDKIIPIDSKFSLENYNRLVVEKDPLERERLEKQFKADLKNRIDETAKYVKADENTMDFAFMFIPHEAIYYDLLVAEVGGIKINTRDLIEYAFKDKHVLIVSPTSFLAFLQTVLQGLRALQIEEKAKDIVKRVEELGRHLKSFEEFYKKMGGSIATVVSHFNSSGKEFRKIDKDVMRITGVGNEIEPIILEKPEDIES
ncbi:MAG: DNA recombination protein RmuC [Candidatus Taylorbacteria bacterium]|nr:DNA recombination protein RmuC [Candidatus Taylorbacteria bacterium]